MVEPEVPPAPEDGAAPEVGASAPDAVFRVMRVESVTYDLSDASPFVHLAESEAPYRSVSVPIALPEAQALYHALHGLVGRRPGTHELASAIIRQLQTDIVAVRIVRYDQGLFYAELDLMTPRGREVIDCRTSDGLTLALRQGVRAPVLCAEEVLAALN